MKKRKIGILFTVYLLAFSLFFAACGNKETSEIDQTSDETLVIGLALEPDHLVPSIKMVSKESGTVLNLMYENLVNADEKTGLLEPGLATEWEWLDDTHFRLTLRDDVYFADGSKFTADDVLYLFQEGKKAFPSMYDFYDVENFEVENDNSIVMATNGIWVQAIELLAQEDYFIVSKDALKVAGGSEVQNKYLELAGTGKYKLVEWIDGQYILLERNDDYWDKDNSAYYKFVKIVFINDGAARAMAVESGDIDIAADISPSQIDALKDNDDLLVDILDTKMAGVLFMNCSNSPLDDERVREAIYWLVDFEALNELTNKGLGTPHETMISPFSPVYDETEVATTREVDVEKAKSLLKEAGYEDGFSLVMRTMPTTKEQAEVLQENLRQANIDVEISINETPVHFGFLRDGDYDLVHSSANYWFYTENLRLVDGRYSTADVYGGANYKRDEDFEQLLDTGYNAFDLEERKEAYKDIQDYVKEHRICIGTNTTIRVEVLRKGLEGIGITPRGWADYSNVKPVSK